MQHPTLQIRDQLLSAGIDKDYNVRTRKKLIFEKNLIKNFGIKEIAKVGSETLLKSLSAKPAEKITKNSLFWVILNRRNPRFVRERKFSNFRRKKSGLKK
jgi:hypothetical protein